MRRVFVHLGCLSNTNAVHWTRVTELRSLFDFSFASHLTGFMKPDHQAYECVTRTLKVPPSEIYFFDDLHENVAAAHEVGFNAFVVCSPQEVESVLVSTGLLPRAGPLV